MALEACLHANGGDNDICVYGIAAELDARVWVGVDEGIEIVDGMRVEFGLYQEYVPARHCGCEQSG